MNYAFLNMCNRASNSNFSRDYKINSKAYERAKKEFQKNNPAHSKEAKEKISKAKKGKNHHYYGARGLELPSYKEEVIYLKHDNGETFSGTRTEAKDTLNLTPSEVTNIINGHKPSARGWRLPQNNGKPIYAKGEKSKSSDHSFFCWYNTKTGEGFVGSRYHFMKKFNLKKRSIQSIISKTRNSVFGWITDKI